MSVGTGLRAIADVCACAVPCFDVGSGGCRKHACDIVYGYECSSGRECGNKRECRNECACE